VCRWHDGREGKAWNRKRKTWGIHGRVKPEEEERRKEHGLWNTEHIFTRDKKGGEKYVGVR
jgi:hypothetical protein